MAIGAWLACLVVLSALHAPQGGFAQAAGHPLGFAQAAARAPGFLGQQVAVEPARRVVGSETSVGRGGRLVGPQAGVRPGARLEGVVTRVADGDTLDVTVGGRAITVRLDGIDAPEGGQPFSAEARRQLRVLVFSQRVTVLVKDKDRYGRLVARVLVGAGERGGGGKDASEEMVRAGLAWHFVRYSSDRRLAQLEAAARARRAGLWSDPSAVAPWTWRGRERAAPSGRTGQAPRRALPPGASAAAPGPYRGNVSSGVYHARSCRDYDCRHCTRVFATREEAESAGFRPHRACVFPVR